jgi:hypothetical protein
MPRIAELREQARLCMEAVKDETDPQRKVRLKSRAVVLTLRAELEAEKDRLRGRAAPLYGRKQATSATAPRERPINDRDEAEGTLSTRSAH